MEQVKVTGEVHPVHLMEKEVVRVILENGGAELDYAALSSAISLRRMADALRILVMVIVFGGVLALTLAVR
jgi:hypothetical protein